MRKRIYRISEDKFDDLKPNIEFSTEFIEAQCYCGEIYEGSFTVKSTNGVPVRGVVYCSNPYVTVADPQFEGDIVAIEFTISDLHCKIGEELTGEFVVVAVGVEQTIPFKITYIKPALKCSTGEIHNLQEFATFAQNRFSEAIRLFYSEEFAEFIKDMDKEVRLLYRGFKGATVSAVNLDEFLVACGLKDTMTFGLDERRDSYYGVTENIRGEIEIVRSTWGFIDIEVSCDADFISIEKNHITADFFLGSVFTMNYYVHKEKMHAGINLARISFDYRDTHKEITVMATTTKEGIVLEHPAHEQNMLRLKLWRGYEEFRLRRVATAQWCSETMALLEAVKPREDEENIILLYKALIFITNKQRQEALWIIQDLKRTIENKRSTEWAFLLYLCTLIEREESYVDRLTDDIESIFRENADDVRIFWFLLFLRKEYIKNPTAKLREIASWIFAGNETPVLYIEAYFVYLQDPYLIASFDDFTLKVLHWAKKHNAITRDIAIQMIHVLESEKRYNPKVIDILIACYEVYPDLQLLLSMVTYMLKAPTAEARFFEWFKLAIESNLHVAGIFEAYMNALPIQSVDKLPQLVTMFFRYNNNLPYERKALLYANIILHKEEDPDTYNQYERTIETFALEQLKQGHLDDNLAICYQQLLAIGIIDKEIAKLLSAYIFKKKVAVIYPNIRRVVLYQDEFKSPTMANVVDHQAYISYMGSKGVLFMEDNSGHMIADSKGYLLEDIMDPMGYMGKLRDMAPQAFPFILHDFANKKDASEFVLEDVEAIEQFINSNNISNAYRLQMYPVLIQAIRNFNREEILEKHFLKDAKLEELRAETIAEIVDVFVIRSRYEEAFYLMQNTNCSLVKLDALTKVCRFMINKKNSTPDDFLIILTAYLVSKGIIHSDMILYLIKYYVGPTELMVSIFRNAFEEGHDIVEFAERILVQALYRDFLCDGIMEVFDTYMSRKTNRMVVEAFLTYQAHSYLSTNEEIADTIFAYIYNRIKKAQNVNESMRIALLRYLCEEEMLDDDDLDMLDMLLADAIFRNQYFGFFSKCHRDLKIKYHLYDKHFVEFKCEKHKTVNVVYSVNGGPVVQEDMIEMYDGLFVKEFVLFFGDELRYEIYCDDISEEPLVSETYIKSDSIDENIGGRYSMINAMQRAKIYQDKTELAVNIKQYQGLDTVTKELFSIL